MERKDIKENEAKGRVGSMLGKKHSKETRKKMSENHWSKKPGYVNPFKGKKLWGNEGLFKKPNPRGMLGKHHTEEWKIEYGEMVKKWWKNPDYRNKIISKIKGQKKPLFTEEHRKKIGEAHKGKHHSPNTEFKKGLKHTQEFKDNMSKNFSGSNHWNWQGGKSFEPYDKKFNNLFKRLVRKRDNQICMLCEVHREKLKRALDIHHIDYNKLNTFPQNCISLCESCHMKTNKNRKYWTNFFQSLLSEKYNYQYLNQEIILTL